MAIFQFFFVLFRAQKIQIGLFVSSTLKQILKKIALYKELIIK